MKKLLFLAAVALSQSTSAQVAGNAAYQNNVRYPDNNISISIPSDATVVASVRGLVNLKADSYVAIYSVTQTGQNAEEAIDLMDRRLAGAVSELKAKSAVETYIDMVSFVPAYEYEVEKKIFSKKTYNEVPAGFELKKNLHIRYTSPEQLAALTTILARAEIYDLVRVDYVSGQLETAKKELAAKARALLAEKLKANEALLGMPFAGAEKNLAEGFRVFLPAEMYKSYEASSNAVLNARKSANVNAATKSTTLYYQPVVDKEFDFVVNPVVLEPVIQVLYEVKMLVDKGRKNYQIITPNGELKTLDLDGK